MLEDGATPPSSQNSKHRPSPISFRPPLADLVIVIFEVRFREPITRHVKSRVGDHS